MEVLIAAGHIFHARNVDIRGLRARRPAVQLKAARRFAITFLHIMYAIIADGSHQYRVEPGNVVWFQSRNEAKPGTRIEFPVLLLVNGDEVRIGTPHVSGAKVVGEIVEHARADKVRVFKYRRRENYHKTIGHRQDHTAVKITEIVAERGP